METNVNIELMTSDFILWRCLHGGPLNVDTILPEEENNALPWMEFYNRNVPLLTKLTRAYGACAVLARHDKEIVGQLRFYPKIVWQISSNKENEFCLQQKFPAGPADNFSNTEFPPFKALEEKTLFVHCIMAGSPQQKENPYQRKGIGTRMAQFLINWARSYGWTAIEVKTYEDIPLLYTLSGCAGKTFWLKQKFYVSRVTTEEILLEETDLTRSLRDSAKGAGIDAALMSNSYTMRLDL
jgi:hypothetical protein